VVVKLLEVDRSDFEKIKSKNSKKRANSRLRTACGGCNRTIRGGGEARGYFEPRQIARGDG
jgi:hypothetical protein